MKIEDINKLTSNKENVLFAIIRKLKQFHFEFAIALMKYKGMPYTVEGLFLILQLFQWLSISFTTINENNWNNDLVHKRLKNYFDCFMISPIFKENEIMLYVLFYVCFGFLVGLYAMYVLIMIEYFKSKTLRIKLITQLKPLLFGVMTLLYMPLLCKPILIIINADLFCSIIHCGNNNESLYLPGLTCWKGIWYLHFVVGFLGVVMTVSLTLAFQPVAYISGYNARVPNAKKTGKIDQINALVKLFTILLYAILYGTINKTSEWIRIVFTVFTGNFLVYCYYFRNPYYNDLMMKMQLIKSAIYSWANFVLLLSKMNESMMTSAFYLFLTGIPLLIYLIITSKDKELYSYLYPMHQLASEEDISNQIRVLMRIGEGYNKNREYLLAIYEYFEFQEDSKIVGSSLYNFIHYLENVNSSSEPSKYSDLVLYYYLYQHIEEVHQYSLAKYPFSSVLLLSYAIFLKDKRGKNKQALIELTKAEQNICTVEDEFCIYRLKKEIIEYGKRDPFPNEHTQTISKFSKGKPYDVSTMIGYQYNFNIFTSLINQISLAYLNFWLLLLSIQKGIRNNLNSLNEYGVKIHNLFDKIQESFHTLQTIKPNDYHVLSLYVSFLKNIKNDINQADMYQKLLSNRDEDKHSFEENNLLLLNISSLNISEYYYVIASCKQDSFELITNISIELCKILGYRKEDLLGKELEILLPDFLRVKHKIVIKERYHKYLQMKEMPQNKGSLAQLNLFAKKQSKYLIPIIIKVGFIPNETEDIFMFGKFIFDETRAKQCFIMTNTNTIIQNCTSNALSMLNVSSYLFNGNIDIMNYIKEFYEGYVYLQSENKSGKNSNKRKHERDKEEIKEMLIKEKYSHKKRSITWRNNAFENNGNSNSNSNANPFLTKNNDGVVVALNSNSIRRESIKSPIQVNDRVLLMSVETVYFSQTKEAYIFGFEIEDDAMCIIGNKSQRNSMMTFNRNKAVKQFGYSIMPSNDIGMTVVSNNISYNINEDNYFGIENNFLPDAKAVMFDPNTLSYTIENSNRNNDSNSNIRKPNEKLSVILEKKVRNTFHQQAIASKLIPELSSSIDEDDSEFGNSNSSNDNNEFELKSSIGEKDDEDNDDNEIISTSIKKQDKNTINDNNADKENQYYKVDISKIRYFIYNYNAKQAIEDTAYTKISQIDTKILKEPHKEFNSPFEPQNKKLKVKTKKQIANSINNNPKEILNLDSTNQKTLQLPNKIDSSVLYLRIINIFITIAFITIGSIYFTFLYSFMKMDWKMASFISSQSVLLSNYQYLLFFSFEIILVNNDKYKGYYLPKEEYTSILTQNLMTIFNESLLITQTLSTDNSPFTSTIRNKTYQLKIPVRVLTPPKIFVGYNLSVFDALFEVLACAYSFANSPSEKQIFINDDFIFLVFNNDKSILNGIIDMISIYQSELSNMVDKDIISMGLFILGFIIMFSLAFVLLIFSFDRVRKKKESYLKVFLNINDFIIQQSIAKCEILIGSKDHSNDINVNNKENNNEDEESTTLSSSSIISSGKPITDLEKEQSKNYKKDNKTDCFNTYHVLIALFLLSFILIEYTFFWRRLKKIIQYSEIYHIFTKSESKYLSLINSAKLYSMFSTKNFKEVNDYRTDLILFLTTIYSFNKEITENITNSIELKQFPSNSTSKYHQIFEGSICYYFSQADNLKNTNLTCESFAGNILSFGLNFAFAYYIEQVRNLNEMVKKATLIAVESGFIFKEAYYGTQVYILNLPKDPVQLELYQKLNPFNIFNTEPFININILLIYVFRPAFKEMRNNIERSFDEEYNFDNKLNWSFHGVYCFFVLVVFVLVLVRKERISNNELQKTKSLLTIIPKNELLKIKNEAESQ